MFTLLKIPAEAFYVQNYIRKKIIIRSVELNAINVEIEQHLLKEKKCKLIPS